MPKLELYQIDAFASEVFRGNPAAVCPLDTWLDETTMQAIACENNLSETAFFVPDGDRFGLRWFTPRHEAELCGHATLATAFVIMTELEPSRTSVQFDSRSGPLAVKRDADLFVMDFPAYSMKPCPEPPELLPRGLNKSPLEFFKVSEDANYFAIFQSEQEIRDLQPNLGLLEQLHPFGVVATAPGDEADCVSRYFAPSYGIPEDPVTGSIHCALAPYWAARLNKKHIRARQLSSRGGELMCEHRADRVTIGGEAVKYLEGAISV